MALPIFQRTVTDNAGNVQPSSTISVFNEATGLPASIFSDRAGTVVKANPFVTGANGFVEFYAAPGEYRVEAVTGSGTITWRYIVLAGTSAVKNTGTGAEEVPKNSDLYVASIPDLSGLTGVAGQRISVTGYHPSATVGGGGFVWGSGIHNGGTFFDPNRVFPTPAEWAAGSSDPAVIAWFYTGGGTVDGWERLNVEYVTPEMFGAFVNLSGISSSSVQAAANAGYKNFKVSEDNLIDTQLILPSNIRLFGGGTIKSTSTPTYKAGTNTSHYGMVVATDETNIEIDGVNFDTTLITSTPGGVFSLRAVLLERCSNVKVQNCKGFVNGGGTAVLGVDNCTIHNNEFYVNAMTGTTDGVIDNWTQGGDMSSLHITENKVFGGGVARWGILVNAVAFGATLWEMTDAVVTDNQVFDCTLDAIWLGGREPKITGFLVTNNTLKNCRKGVSLSSCQNGSVTNNIITECSSRGIDGFKEGGYTGEISCENTLIADNNISKASGSTGIGIELTDDCAENTLERNNLRDAAYEYSYVMGSSTEKNTIDIGVPSGALFDLADSSGANIYRSRSYTPTLANNANFSALSLTSARYKLVGNIIEVYVSVSATPTTAGVFSEFTVSLPTLYNVGNIQGVGSNVRFSAIVGNGGTVATVGSFPTVTSATTYNITFTYSIDY